MDGKLVKVGDIIRWDRAHGNDLPEPVWSYMHTYKNRRHFGIVMAGKSGRQWRPGCPCSIARNLSNDTIRATRWEIVPEEKVPPEVWAEFAKYTANLLIEGE